ncbi:Cytochrome P450 [Streptomyces sp. DvalAA-14]|uniref:cytochrome P450 n=1 Tax=unclassified Streptomyces TaxID=2593676 RepID=UPI00081AEBD9|nr:MULTISPECIES: cytochrome P450 [unclassified Streptomyces]MYS21314.1 cytochrome P450 [Streptomyces sp. SID4948]SCD89632.1 Cytochrome P450 [Streptomyces sp. DvalAA-14]
MPQHAGEHEPPSGCPVAHDRTALYGPEFGADPDAHYAYLRGFGPTAPVEIAPGVPVELVTSYSTALRILQNPSTFVRDSRRWRDLNEGRIPADSPALPMMAYRPNALFSDGAAHARLRNAVTDSLATVDEHRLTRLVQRVAEYLISQFSGRRIGNADLVADYAQQLPLLVYSDLFGCPADIGDRIILGISGIFEGADGANEILGGALMELIALKRRQPGDDVTSRMMQHPSKLTDAEMANQLVTLLSGGTAPMQSLIGVGAALMLGDDRYMQTQSSAGLLVEDAVSEVLWNYAPIANYAVHYPVHDVEVDGKVLRADDPVVISFAAANTDPAMAQDRSLTGGRAHLAFGAGPHVCPAKDPAMVIAVTAIETLLNRLPDIELRIDLKDLSWVPAPWSRSLITLPVRFTPKAQSAQQPLAAASGTGSAARAATPAPPAKNTRWSKFLGWLNGGV